MQKRFVSIWLPNLRTDWFNRRQPGLKDIPFSLASADHGRMMISAPNQLAQNEGVHIGLTVADARAILPSLVVMDDQPEIVNKVLKGLAEYCIRFTPVAAIDLDDGLMLEATGCAHLWGGEKQYLTEIYTRFKRFGYDIRISIADTIGTAWAVARFGQQSRIISSSQHIEALLKLPAASLRLEEGIVARLEKLGLRKLRQFVNMPRPALRRRFGQQLLDRIDEATGSREEFLLPVHPIEAYHERLPCLEPIATATGIEIALKRLLEAICQRLQHEQKGLRIAEFKGYRLDGKMLKIEIGTNRPSSNSKHLFKLFEIKIDSLEPALGIELFTMDALKVEDLATSQESLWKVKDGLENNDLAELLDRIAGKFGSNIIHRYVPAEHYWPERSFKPANDINEKMETVWHVYNPRPVQLLGKPEPVEVTAPIPDYPPMMFRYKGKLHKILKADGPERIEQEWWLQQGEHRDYYSVEDEEGFRYWIFRSGHYDAEKTYQWFIHGFFA
ncbi:MAG: DNA polymerase Y family protein [Ferruginibacter sp.]